MKVRMVGLSEDQRDEYEVSWTVGFPECHRYSLYVDQDRAITLLVGLLSYRDDDIGPQQADLINLAIAKVKAAKEEYLKLENSRHEVELEFSSREFALYSLGENRRVISVEEVNSGGIVVKLVDSPDYSDIFCLSDCDPERLDVMVAQL